MIKSSLSLSSKLDTCSKMVFIFNDIYDTFVAFNIETKALQYLMDHCSPFSDLVFRQRLRSASSHQLFVPRHRLRLHMGHKAVAHFLLMARLFGTHYLKVFGIRNVL